MTGYNNKTFYLVKDEYQYSCSAKMIYTEYNETMKMMATVIWPGEKTWVKTETSPGVYRFDLRKYKIGEKAFSAKFAFNFYNPIPK